MSDARGFVRARDAPIPREVRNLVRDGLSPCPAEIAARNNLAVRLLELDEEVTGELGRLRAEVRRRLKRLVEELEDERS